MFCPQCGRPLQETGRDGVEVEAQCPAGHRWAILEGDGWVEGFQCNEGDRG